MWSKSAEAHLANACGEIARIADGASGKAICRVWGEEGVISAAIFFERGAKVVFKFPSRALTNELLLLWDECAAVKEPWRLLTIAIEGGKFSVEVCYPDEAGEMHAALDPAQNVKEHFGADQWDDADPEIDEPREKKRSWWRR